MAKKLPKRYELLLKLEEKNSRWYVGIADDDERLVELRKAWLGKSKNISKSEYKYTDENLIMLIRHGYRVPEITEIVSAPKYAIKNRVRVHENVKQVWEIAVKARKTLVIEKDDKTVFAVGGLKAAGKVLHIRPSRVRNIMNNMNSDYDISWYFDCYDTIDELEEYLHESEKRK